MKIAIVTGASSGIGNEFVRQIGTFYKKLDEIWVIARREERLKELITISQTPLRIFSGDLLDDILYDAVEAALNNEVPDIRMLVNAAGFGKNGTVESILKEDKNTQLQMIDLNCRALSKMVFLCLPFCSNGTRILNIASAAAFCPQPHFSVYAATKSYVLSFSRSLASELRKKGIYVTAVCPGPVDTEFFNTAGSVTNSLKQWTMADAPAVVRQAIIDSRAKRTLSIYGFAMKCSYISTKLLPHRLIMKLLYEK